MGKDQIYFPCSSCHGQTHTHVQPGDSNRHLSWNNQGFPMIKQIDELCLTFTRKWLDDWPSAVIIPIYSSLLLAVFDLFSRLRHEEEWMIGSYQWSQLPWYSRDKASIWPESPHHVGPFPISIAVAMTIESRHKDISSGHFSLEQEQQNQSWSMRGGKKVIVYDTNGAEDNENPSAQERKVIYVYTYISVHCVIALFFNLHRNVSEGRQAEQETRSLDSCWRRERERERRRHFTSR